MAIFRIALAGALLAATSVLAACGSTATALPSSPANLRTPASQDAVSPGTVRVQVVALVEIVDAKITKLPAENADGLAYVSPATRSIVFSYASGAPIAVNLGSGSKDCKKGALGITCRIQFAVARDSYDFSFVTYDRPLAHGTSSGHILNYGFTRQSSRAKETDLRFAMDAVVGKVKIASMNRTPTCGTKTNLGLVLDVLDPRGFRILYGTYANSEGFAATRLDIDFATQPGGANDFVVTVNGKQSYSIEGASDRYAIVYLGSGVVSGTISIGQAYIPSTFASATIEPIFKTKPVAGAKHAIAASSLIVPVSGQIYFLEPSGKIGSIVGGVATEVTLPSGNTPTLLALSYYNSPLVILDFATSQNTLGTVDNQRDVNESAALPGAPITGLSGGKSPYFAQQSGDLDKWYSGFAPGTGQFQIPGTPRLTNVAYGLSGDYAVADPGNKSVALFPDSIPAFDHFSEKRLPHGTPSFVAAGPNSSIWVALEKEQGGYIVDQQGGGSAPIAFESRAPLTSMAMMAFGYEAQGPIAATDTNGNIEFFDLTGKWVRTYTPPGGAATDIVAGADQDMLFICSTCKNGIQELTY